MWCEGISRLGLPVGPWLREAKRALRQGAPDHSEVCVRDGLVISLGNLKQHALRTAPGQKNRLRGRFRLQGAEHRESRRIGAGCRPPLHRGPVPRRRRQYRRRKMAFNGAPGGRQTSVRRPPHSISLLGSLSGPRGRTGSDCALSTFGATPDFAGRGQRIAVVAKRIFSESYSKPLDCGATFIDGRPVCGSSKTIRGILSSITATTASAPLLSLEPEIGGLIAVAAMSGDLLSSFIKRRVGLPPSSQALGLDQIPKSLLPLLACSFILPLTIPDILIGTVLFMVGELLLSHLLFKLHVRDRPY